MRKAISWLFLLSFIMVSGCSKAEKKEYQDPYDPKAAIAYADQYARVRNPEYADFQTNCTNYISQILVAGGKQMDEPIPPEKDVRITYHDEGDLWFSDSIETEPARWREFSVSTSFCRSSDFVEYWTKVRGMELTHYSNNVVGLKSLYKEAKEGDVIVLYDPDGGIAHLCFLVEKKAQRLLVNANTNDYYKHNIMAISPQSYPELALMKIK